MVLRRSSSAYRLAACDPLRNRSECCGDQARRLRLQNNPVGFTLPFYAHIATASSSSSTILRSSRRTIAKCLPPPKNPARSTINASKTTLWTSVTTALYYCISVWVPIFQLSAPWANRYRCRPSSRPRSNLPSTYYAPQGLPTTLFNTAHSKHSKDYGTQGVRFEDQIAHLLQQTMYEDPLKGVLAMSS